MVDGLLDLGLRRDCKSALCADLPGRGNGGAHTIPHHGLDLGVEGGTPGAQALAGSRFSYAKIALDHMYGVAPYGNEQDRRIAEHYDPQRRDGAGQRME